MGKWCVRSREIGCKIEKETSMLLQVKLCGRQHSGYYNFTCECQTSSKLK